VDGFVGVAVEDVEARTAQNSFHRLPRRASWWERKTCAQKYGSSAADFASGVFLALVMLIQATLTRARRLS
jgi:hypothetical protein